MNAAPIRHGRPAPSRRPLSALVLASTLLGNGVASATDHVTLELKDADATVVGRATLTALPGGGVHIDARFDGLSPGTHGFHLHETGSCDASTDFKSAGGHIAAGREHGFLVEGGPHPGDMPNVHVPESGSLHVEIVNTLVSLETEGDGALLDSDGSALMVHSDADDYTSQPGGKAGDRIACAEIPAGT